MMKELLGKRVIHERVYGCGTIIECEDRSNNNRDLLITVRFDSSKKEAKFTYPGSFNGILQFDIQDDREKDEADRRIEVERKKADKRNIEKIIRDRKIKSLLHVTQLNNLESILANGIIPVDELNDIKAAINDEERNEGRKDCSSFSIGRMNKYYFGKKNRDNDYSLSFVCLHIDPYILADDKVKYFCPSNAASNNVSSRIRDGGLSTSEDFQHIFDESIVAPTINRDGYWKREPGWPDSWPTDWQAEVLYQGIVHPQHILKVEFKSGEDLEKSKEILKKYGIKGSVNRSLNFW